MKGSIIKKQVWCQFIYFNLNHMVRFKINRRVVLLFLLCDAKKRSGELKIVILKMKNI
jgi:hypothetical protein